MTASEVRDLIRECERLAGIDHASSHRKARIWRETVDKRSGDVTRDQAALLSPLTLAMNRLYDGASWRGARRSEPAALTSEAPPNPASG